jgi:KaiC/GvpD/RAD55 family RecA-like ATPase
MDIENKELDPLEKFKRLIDNDEVVLLAHATERNGEYTTPYPIGFASLDEAMKGGVRKGDMVVLTGLSGSGKSLFCQNISLNLMKSGHKCLWFQYELLFDNLYAKWKEMGYEGENLVIYTPRKMTTGNIEWIYRKIVEAKEKYGADFVFIDHLDFLSPKIEKKSSDQHRLVIMEICMELKRMAIDLDVVVFLVSHVKKVQGRAIELQDLAESSGTYKLADLVMVVEREMCKQTLGIREVEMFLGTSGFVRILKNRVTGINSFFYYDVKNGVFIPKEFLSEEEKKARDAAEKKEKEETDETINVVNSTSAMDMVNDFDKRQNGFFGDKT